MKRFGIDPWNDELARRIQRAKRTVQLLRATPPPFEQDHFPRYDWRDQ